MPIRCPDCGRDNRDTANFCIGCGRHDLQMLAAQAWAPPTPQPAPSPLAPVQLSPLAPQPPLAFVAPHRRRRVLWILANEPILEGVVEISNQHEVYPPPDRALTLVKLSLVLAVLPIA